MGSHVTSGSGAKEDYLPGMCNLYNPANNLLKRLFG
jgi:hypothetical protein